MAERYDVIAFKKGANDKVFPVRCGSAVPRKEGGGFNLYLDAMPAPENGQWQMSVVQPKPRSGGGGDY